MNNLNRSRDILNDVGLKLLSEGKTIRIKAHGYSMYPCIKPGSIILIEPIANKGLPAVGEIVAIRREKGLIVHRLSKIMKINGVTSYITRGDSNARPDNPVKIGYIAGRIVRAETSGENQAADIRINTRPDYFVNRLRVISLIIWQKLRKILRKRE